MTVVDVKARSSQALDFYGSVHEAFARARAACGLERRYVALDRFVVSLEFAGDGLVEQFLPALAHLASPPVATPDFTIRLFDSQTTGIQIPPPPWSRDAYLAKGEIAGFNDNCIRTLFQPGTDALNLNDREQRVGLYWVRSPAALPFWERSSPLRAQLHWWLEDLDLQLVHAGAVGYGDGGVLLAGRGGSGKSTSTLACLDSDLLYAGDDYVVIKPGPAPQVFSLYQTAKLEPDNLHRLPHLKACIDNEARLSDEKALLFPGRAYPDRVTRGFPLRALLLPRITGGRDTRISASSSAAGLSALAPTTVFQLPGDSARVFAKVARLIRQVPTHVLELGTDLAQIPSVIGRFLREHDA